MSLERDLKIAKQFEINHSTIMKIVLKFSRFQATADLAVPTNSTQELTISC